MDYKALFFASTLTLNMVNAAAFELERDTIFVNGEQSDSKISFFLDVQDIDTLSEKSPFSISTTIQVESDHVGHSGSIYVLAIYEGAAWMKTSGGYWKPWDRKLSSLEPFQSFTADSGLPESVSETIADDLSDLPGKFLIHVGYTNNDGALIFNPQGFEFTVSQDFSDAETGELLMGGNGTVFNVSKNAFSLPTASLSLIGRQDFSVGNSFFRNPWVTAPASTTARDGLGPLFNTNACQNCHLKDGRGHPPENNQDSAISMLVRLSVPPQNEQDLALLTTQGVIPDPVYGTQLQDFAVPGVSSEGQINIEYQTVTVEFDDNFRVFLRQPTYQIEQLNYGPLDSQIMLSPRIAPPMIGLGLLDAISNETILSRHDPDDFDGDGISGRANYVWDVEQQQMTLGRFGWKASSPNVKQQSAGAFNGDMGLTSTLFLQDGCSEIQTLCLQAPDGGIPEVSDLILDFVVFYASNLAVPARRDVDNPEVLNGKKLFHEAQCDACHIPTLTTGNTSQFSELNNQIIRPYTDLLLHDMGPGLADNRPDFLASGSEWRTPPLWGIGLTGTVNGHTNFLHDGRARNLLEAILWHDGEAAESRQFVLSLNAEERASLIRFLDSL